MPYDPNTGQYYDAGTGYGGGYYPYPSDPRYTQGGQNQYPASSAYPYGYSFQGGDILVPGQAPGGQASGANGAWSGSPTDVRNLAYKIAAQTHTPPPSEENINDWMSKVSQNPGQSLDYWTSQFTNKALEPDTSQYGGQFGSGYGMYGSPLFQASSPFGGYSPINVGQFSYQPFNAPGQFQLPTGQQALDQDPGYQFRLQQGIDALQNSAASRGGLGDPNTARAIQDYGQQSASGEYQNAYNRALQTYQTNTGTDLQAQNQQFNQGLGAFQTNAQTALQANNQNFQNSLAQYQTNFSDPLAAYQANVNSQLGFGNLGVAQGGLGINQGYLGLAANQQAFNQPYQLAQLGLQGTEAAANTGLGYFNGLTNLYGSNANSMGNLYTGQGNANAAGQVGSANAWQGALGNAGNLGLGLGAWAANRPRPVTPPPPPTSGGW